MSTKTLMTVEEFEQMQTAETEDYELVEGELIPLSRATPIHAEIRDLVGHLLWTYFKGNPIGKAFGEIDCRIAEDTVRRPDVSIFLGAERLNQMDRKKIPAPFSPDIAVEVLSPSESAVDVRRKVLDYLRAGSQEVWLVDHANSEILVHSGSGIRVFEEKDVLASPLLPGFSAAVADLVRL
jgi:Uma2 family endonuclease